MRKKTEENQKNQKLSVVFDFDGTIAETLSAGVDILNRLSGEFGFRPVKREEIDNLRGKTLSEVLKIFHISFLKLPVLVSRVKKEMAKSIEQIKMVPGIKNAIDEVKSVGLSAGMLSSNSEDNLEKFCAKNDLSFDFIYSGGSIFGKDRVIRKMMRREKLGAKKIIYVGDEVRDIAAARKTGVRIVSVSWGFNNRSILEKACPDFLIDRPAEILPIIRKILA